ncbi:MAG TPA: fibronectin type III domain-containing protein, partial [Terriglobales bacterium]|nr:fibronectin type III domain-containing protein [Terriglobales bacterium]
NSAVLGPDGNLYVGFKRSGQLLRITAPETEPLPCANVVVIGTTPDRVRDMGLGWIGHDLFGGDSRAAFVMPNADQCMTPQNGNLPCVSNNILAGSTAAPTAVISDQIYPAVNGRNLLVGQPGSITLVNPASLQVITNYVSGFQLLTAMALDPTNLELYVADDPSAGKLPQQGHWYVTIPLQVTPASPGAPVGVFATAGNASATVQWTPAPDGQTITSYIVRNSFVSAGSPVSDVLINPAPGSTVVPTSVNIGGLSNGVSYQFEVAAVDTVGTSPFSAPSNTVTPFVPSVPLPPTNIVAVAHDSSATVQWTAVPDYQNGGFPIQIYKVEVEIDGVETGQVLDVSPLFNTATVPGLKNGTIYTFVVVATNRIGDSALSLPSNAVTPAAASPAAVPGEPTLVTAVAGNASATVNWTAPVSDGGSPITGYMIVPLINNSPTVLSNVVPAPATSATITGLINGNSYTFTVSAINAAGEGGASAPSNAVTPFAPAPPPISGVPGVPTLVHATAGVNSATVSWIAPANPGSGVTSYNVVAFVGGTPVGASITVPAPVTGATITNLIAGTTYTFAVHAINSAGDSGASAPSNAVTPSAAATAPGSAPGLPTGVSAIGGNASATVSWLAPASDGGSAVLNYNVVALAAGAPAGISLQVAAPALKAVVTGLTNGTAYTFVVHAINAKGDSGPSAPSNAATPAAATATGNANLSVTISGPATSLVGANAAFTLLVTNLGAAAVPTATVHDIFNPSAGALVSHVSSQGTCTEGFASLDCNLGSIAAGGSASVSFTLKITATLQNRAVAEALDASGQRIPSSSPAQSTVSLSTAVSTPVSVSTTADLQISGTSVGTGAQTTVVWLISNAQAQPANAVKFIDQLPSALQFVSVNTSAGVNCTAPTSSSGGVLACGLDVLPGGQGVLIAVTANVSAAAALPIANTANVSFGGIDSNTANNSSTVNIGPAPAPAAPGNPAPAPAPGGGGAPSGGSAAGGGQPTGGRGAVCAPPVIGGRGGAAAHTGEGGLLPGACGGA